MKVIALPFNGTEGRLRSLDTRKAMPIEKLDYDEFIYTKNFR